MNISVFGLGYVGCVSAACFAKSENLVFGVDTNHIKIKSLKSGVSPIVEKGLDKIINDVIKDGSLRVSNDGFDAVLKSDLSIICVGTPSGENNDQVLYYIENVCKEIGESLQKKDDYYTIVIRSTVLPGTIENILIPLLEKTSNKKIGRDFGIVSNPEFLREGSSLTDFFNPPFTLIGTREKKDGDFVERLYNKINAPVIRCDIKTAEMVKYACNAFHGLKISFANEIGNICMVEGIDSHKVMDILCQDKKLNISSAYLKPGFAFGGSCLKKDINALIYKSQKKNIELELLPSILKSNNNQIKRAFDIISRKNKKNIGILGIAFKEGTDDLRESPIVELVEILLGKGYFIKIFDKNVSIAKIFGSNKRYIDSVLPHIANLMCDSIEEIVTSSELIVIGNKNEEIYKLQSLVSPSHFVIDLVGISYENNNLKGKLIKIN